MPDFNQSNTTDPNSVDTAEGAPTPNPITEQAIAEDTFGEFFGNALGSMLALPTALTMKPSDLEEDGKYEGILKSLEKKAKENRKDFFDTKEGIDYRYGDLDDPTKPTIHDEAEKIFREKHPDRIKRYDDKRAKEQKKIHKGLFFRRPDPHSDPEYLRVQHIMHKHTNERIELIDKKIKKTKDKEERKKLEEEKKDIAEKVEKHHYKEFAKKFREKAEAYSPKNKSIQEALAEVKKGEAAQKAAREAKPEEKAEPQEETATATPSPVVPEEQTAETSPDVQLQTQPTTNEPNIQTSTPAPEQQPTPAQTPASHDSSSSTEQHATARQGEHTQPSTPTTSTPHTPTVSAPNTSAQPPVRNFAEQRSIENLIRAQTQIPRSSPTISIATHLNEEQSQPREPQQDSSQQRGQSLVDRGNQMYDNFKRFSKMGKNAKTISQTAEASANVAKAGGWLGRIGSSLSGLFGGGAAAGGTVAGGGATVAGGGTALIVIVIIIIVLLFALIIIFVVGCASGQIQCTDPNGGQPGSEPERGGNIYECTFYRMADSGQEKQLKFGTQEMASLISDVSAKVGVPAPIVAGIMAVESSQGITQTNIDYVTNDYNAVTSIDENGNPVATGIMQFTPGTFRGIQSQNINQLQTLFGKGTGIRDSVDPQDSVTAKDTSLFRIYSIKDSVTAAAFKVKADKQTINGYGPWDKDTVSKIAASYYAGNKNGCTKYPSCTNGPYDYGEDLWKTFSSCRPTTTPGGGFMSGWPVSGYVVQGILGKTSHSALFTGFLEQALDISNSAGTPTYSSMNGVVKTVDDSCITDSSCKTGYGNFVDISDSAYSVTIRYAHLSLISVLQGQAIQIGTKIGEVGASGYVTGPHLHYAILDGLASRPNDPVKMEPPNIPEKVTPDNCDVPSTACTPAQVSYSSSGEATAPSSDAYWFLLERKSKKETLYQGKPGDKTNSRIIRNFQVNPGWPGQTPTPLSTKLSIPYWIITTYKTNTTDEQKSKLGPYFLSLNIPYSDPGSNCPINGVNKNCQGPTPYLECPDRTNNQCYWPVPGEFGLHGVGNSISRLTDEGSNGCIRHSNEDISYLYDLLSKYNKEVRYYTVDE